MFGQSLVFWATFGVTLLSLLIPSFTYAHGTLASSHVFHLS
jgi:hypothetical protein